MTPASPTHALLVGFIGIFASYFGHQDLNQDKIQGKKDTQDLFDFIVVGAGSAGAVAANRLSKNFKVLLLEAGGEPNPLHSIPALAPLMLRQPMVDWNYVIEPQKHSCFALKNNVSIMSTAWNSPAVSLTVASMSYLLQQLPWARGKSLGGSSNLNFLVYTRGHPKDFDNWAKITGDSRWSYTNVLPFFKTSEDYRGRWANGTHRYHSHGNELKVQPSPHYTMADDFVQAGQELGYPQIDPNANYTEGFSKTYSTQDKGRRCSTYEAFIKPARQRKNLHIYKFAHVTKVLINETNMRAYGVEYVRHGLKRQAFATKEIVISAGTLSSPQILKLSGIGPPEELNKFQIPVLADLPVGKNLHDHVACLVGPFKFGRAQSPLEDQLASMKALRDYARSGTGPLSSSNVQATAFLVSPINAQNEPNQRDWPDEQFFWFGTDLSEIFNPELARISNMREDLVNDFLKPYDGRLTFYVSNWNVRPFSRGEAKLQSADPFVPLSFNPNYLKDSRDVRVLIDGAKTAMKLIQNTTVFQRLGASMFNEPFLGCKDYIFLSDDYWECYHRSVTIPGYHQVGTCAMGRRGSPYAVVDSQLRVIGIEGLRVADASVMPQVPTANTNAATVMIGEVASHLIASDWSS